MVDALMVGAYVSRFLFYARLTEMDTDKTKEQLTSELEALRARLAKLEQAIELNTMPTKDFLLMHWNGRLSSGEKEALLTWIREVRAKNYATGLAAESFVADSVQPLPDSVPEPLSQQKIMLGDKLYHDKRLSGDDTLACAGCHAPRTKPGRAMAQNIHPVSYVCLNRPQFF